MDYEKAYKAVLKTATQWIKDGCTDKEKICLECVFPELAESEDERVRKEIINFILYEAGALIDEDTEHRWITWLERQKEPQWKPSEEQIVNATYNDLCEVYERIRTEMLRRHQDIAINIKEGQR